MNLLNTKALLNQLNPNLLSDVTDESASKIAGGHKYQFDEPSASIVECLIFDLDGDAVMIREASIRATKSPKISLASMPQ